MPKYKVGEILIVHSVTNPDHMYMNGEEVEVKSWEGNRKEQYEIIFFNDSINKKSKTGVWDCPEQFLKRREPPTDFKGIRGDMDKPISWDEFEKTIGWRPKELTDA